MARSAFDLTLRIIRSEVLKSTQINMIFSYKNYNNKRHLKPLLFSNFFSKTEGYINVSVLLKVLLNLQPKLYVLLKYLFSKTCEFRRIWLPVSEKSNSCKGSLKRFFSEQYVHNSVDTHMH
jgi:hypothetical protein